ncbi:unnamed protein product [Sphagnum tenellum]
MGEITHRFIKTNGITLHIAEQGPSDGTVVLLLHGFPELWYSWRYQMPALAEAGFHAIAPDMRGYGQSEAPAGIDQYTQFHVVGDIIGLLDTLDLKQVFLVGHDWGSCIGWEICRWRPDRVIAYVAVSVPFLIRDPDCNGVTKITALLGEGIYVNRFQELGRAECDFASLGTAEILKSFICGGFNSDKDGQISQLIAPKGKELSTVLPRLDDEKLPSWFTAADLKCYTDNYNKSSFTGPLNYYRNLDRNWQLSAPWSNSPVHTKVLFITGNLDAGLAFYGGFVFGPDFKNFVPNLKDIITIEGGHFIHEEQAEKFNQLLISFFNTVLHK